MPQEDVSLERSAKPLSVLWGGLPGRLRLSGLAFLLLTFTAHAADSSSRGRELIPLVGSRQAAALVSIAVSGEMHFRTDEIDQRLQTGELVCWGAPAEPRSDAQLLLADGGSISIRKNPPPTTDQEQLVALSDTFGELTVPLKQLAGIMLHAPIDPQRRDSLAARLRGPKQDADETPPLKNADRLLLENGDDLAGRIVALTETAVEFEAEIGPLTVELERVLALAFNPSLRSTAIENEPRCLVGLADGSILTAKTLALKNGRLEISPAGMATFLSGDTEPVFLQPLAASAKYLSDLKPAGYRHLPYLSLPYAWYLDANVTGTRLRAGGQLYAKGIGMHSAARLTWQLGKNYRRFEADLAIDDQTGGRGSVVFRVFSGTREIYKSRVVRGGDAPIAMSVDIRDARQLSLVVDYSDRADVLDHADWLNARLIP